MTDRVGQQLGNYRLVSLLGEGGFAEVYLGEHIHLGTQAAIKVLHTQLASDDLEQFRTEARTIARLEHPHIVRILDFGVEGKTPFLVMSHTPNGTLRHRHPKGTQLPLTTIVSYVKQAASALQYAHEQHILHRDIKPENMLLGRRNEVLLSDFGIATVAQSTQDVLGTVTYMAPEQIQGKPCPASDQYALAVLVYELLTGRTPFEGNAMQVMFAHIHLQPQLPSSLNPGLPAPVDATILRALAKRPEDRFPSIQAFADAFEEAVQQPPQPTVTPPRWELPPQSTMPAPRWELPSRAVPAPGRLPGVLAIVFLAALLIAGGTYLLVRGSANSNVVFLSQMVLFTAAICLVPTVVSLLIRRRK